MEPLFHVQIYLMRHYLIARQVPCYDASIHPGSNAYGGLSETSLGTCDFHQRQGPVALHVDICLLYAPLVATNNTSHYYTYI